MTELVIARHRVQSEQVTVYNWVTGTHVEIQVFHGLDEQGRTYAYVLVEPAFFAPPDLEKP